jgi:hypothetical protein
LILRGDSHRNGFQTLEPSRGFKVSALFATMQGNATLRAFVLKANSLRKGRGTAKAS